ncbi:MAG: nickel pincer cofactor biosynthesis protein LarB [Candidatus Altiarchaeota archaeon]|nr:nickel pincer cofactor biosynthesis protein LarB [Candidatus Altiarchaeota archaeon]
MKVMNHDLEREERCAIPEVVYGAGKSAEDIVEIRDGFLRDSGRLIATRMDEDKSLKVIRGVDRKKFTVNYNRRGKVLVIKKKGFETKDVGLVGILTAGTSDIGVAEEAKAVAEELGCKIEFEYDVGIAGIHRVFPALERLKKSKVFIVVAGMEGALPSIVAGLVREPVIAVPTSVGYGSAEKGKSALSTMLNSCTPLAVMNIDNGYGAAVLAYKILATK